MSIKSSVNQVELEKFSNISSSWWLEDGEFKMLHQINPIRLHYIIDKITKHFHIKNNTPQFPNLEILDIGCGGGLVSSNLSKLNNDLYSNAFTITGIDPLQDNIDVAVQQAQKENLSVNYIKSTIEELISANSKSYDVVLCLELMEHIDNHSDFVKNLTNLVKPNGMIIISTINRTLKAYIFAILMAEYVLGWVPKKTHDYNKFLKPSEINSMFSKNNIELKELKGLTYNLTNRIWQLSEDIEVNYFAYLIKTNSSMNLPNNI